MRTLLAILSSMTVLATGYLSLSLVILRPSRATYQEWMPMAALFLLQGVLTVAALAHRVSGRVIRGALLAGAIAILCVGGMWVHATASGPHFEGYALVLGSALVIQGVLTVPVFWQAPAR